MELLVVTLAQTTIGRETDVLTRVRLIIETIRNAPGLIRSHFYRGRNSDPYYFMFTTWADEESWRKAQERHDPRRLLQEEMELLTAPPEQWFMHYLWGYSRPTDPPAVATVHLTSILPEQINRIQQAWLHELHQYSLQSLLAFAFLARGIEEDRTVQRIVARPSRLKQGETAYIQGPILFNFFSWTNEIDREEFYAHPRYTALRNNGGREEHTRILQLEPI